MIARFMRYAASVAAAATVVAHASIAGAYTVNVNTTANDTSAGHCSLNEAINLFYGETPIGTCAWVADGSNNYTIQLIAGTFTNFGIYISGFTLNGAGQTKTTILTNNNYQEGLYFDTYNLSGAASNLTVKGENQSSSTPVPGVHNEITATLTNVTITGYTGAGIYNLGSLTINSSTITGNSSSLGNGDAAGLGGGICNYGQLTINTSTISGNKASQGAGVYSTDTYGYGAYVEINTSAFSNNTATSDGGGLWDGGNQTSFVNNSTFNGNSAWHGGGIYESTGQLEITYSTIANNTASSQGGGVYVSSSSPGTEAYHATVAFNTAGSAKSTCGNGGGVYTTNVSEDWNGSIVAGNTGTGSGEDDFTGTIHSGSEWSTGANPTFISHAVCNPTGWKKQVTNTGPGTGYPLAYFNDSVFTVAQLFGSNTLHANGGPTETILLTLGNKTAKPPVPPSPAINACQSLANNVFGVNGLNTTDQRGSGFPAPLGKIYDLGAVEVQ